MTNHVQRLVTPNESDPISRLMQFLLRQYVRYIELNPVRAGMVDDPVEYYWSSYPANAFRKPLELGSPHPEYWNLGLESSVRQWRYRALFEVAIAREMVANIRQSAQRGLASGSDRFKGEIEALGDRRQRLSNCGPQLAG